jgi:hypothetical protein
MPDALIVCQKDYQRYGKINYEKIMKSLERKGIIQTVTVQGKKVWGRHYLAPAAIRGAYYKQKKG